MSQMFGPKLEYFYFVSGTEPKPIDQAGYLDLNSADLSHSLRYSTSRALENLSIPVQYSFHAAGPAQNGVELRYAEALTCADNIVTARLVSDILQHFTVCLLRLCQSLFRVSLAQPCF